jgi:hypothetical protein
MQHASVEASVVILVAWVVVVVVLPGMELWCSVEALFVVGKVNESLKVAVVYQEITFVALVLEVIVQG